MGSGPVGMTLQLSSSTTESHNGLSSGKWLPNTLLVTLTWFIQWWSLVWLSSVISLTLWKMSKLSKAISHPGPISFSITLPPLFPFSVSTTEVSVFKPSRFAETVGHVWNVAPVTNAFSAITDWFVKSHEGVAWLKLPWDSYNLLEKYGMWH